MYVGIGGRPWAGTCAHARLLPRRTPSLQPSNTQNSSLPGGMPAPLLTPADKAVLSCCEIVLMGAGAGLPLKGSSSANHRDSTTPETHTKPRNPTHTGHKDRGRSGTACQGAHDLRGRSGRGAARRGVKGFMRGSSRTQARAGNAAAGSATATDKRRQTQQQGRGFQQQFWGCQRWG